MKLIFVTGNEGKLREIREMTAGLGDFEVVSVKEAGLECEIEENGLTFSENALIKVRAVGAQQDAVVMADDSGLCIDALNGEPGVYSARYMGEDTSYQIKNNAILDRMKPYSGSERSARFACSIALLFPDGTEAVAEGTVEGVIADRIAGENGFGYDPIFYVPKWKKTTAEMDEAEKNSISHRRRALDGAKQILKDRGYGIE